MIYFNNLLEKIHLNFDNKFYSDLYLTDNKVHKNDNVQYLLVDNEFHKIDAIDDIV